MKLLPNEPRSSGRESAPSETQQGQGQLTWIGTFRSSTRESFRWTLALLVFLHVGFAFTLPAQRGLDAGSPEITERGPHHRIWQRVMAEASPSGQVHYRTNSYQELATGMHFRDANGPWTESRAEIQLTANGAAATNAAHKVFFAADVNSTNAVVLTMPDGQQRLRSRVLGLSYFDGASGRAVLIAETTNSIGQLIALNTVLYTNAFDGVKADLQYVFTRAGLAQNVVLREQPPSPEDSGLNPETTRLQVLTEFFDPPVPQKTTMQMPEGLTDQSISFGDMRIGPGKAFAIGNESNPRDSVPVLKEWAVVDGRTFLVEEVPLAKIASQLTALPKAATASIYKRAVGEGETVIAALGKRLPQLAAKPKRERGKMQLAQLDSSVGTPRRSVRAPTGRNPVPAAPPQVAQRVKPLTPSLSPSDGERVAEGRVWGFSDSRPGFVLDYEINGSYTDFTFQGDTTYYVSGTVFLAGTTTIEGGSVIKFAPYHPGIYMQFDGTVRCLTGPYRPAIFTAKDDNSVGEVISGSTGTPSGYYASTAIYAPGSPTGDLHHLHIRHARSAITWYYAASRFSDLQLVNCYYGIGRTYNTAPIHNVLLNNVVQAFWGYAVNYDIQHATVNQCTELASVYGTFSQGYINLTNCVLANVSSWGGYNQLNANYNGRYNTPPLSQLNDFPAAANPFETVGGGNHYLAAASGFRDVGTSVINPAMADELNRTTTEPPVVYADITLPPNLTLGPQAARDTDTPDLGYHYESLDYAFGGCRANSDLTFTAGTAMGWFRTFSGWYHAGQAIRMQGNITVDFQGTANAPTYWVRLNTVVEQDVTAGFGHGSIENWEGPSIPIVRGQFLRCSAMAGETFDGYFADDFGPLRAEMTDCEFWSGALGSYGNYMYYTNCLMRRVAMALWNGSANAARVLRNCTFFGGAFTLQRNVSGPTPVLVRDCAFDGTSISTADYWGSNAGLSDYNYNAYTQPMNPFSIGGANDVPGVTFNWQNGSLGNFYLPVGSPLIDAGSREADDAGLHHYTTQVSQTPEGDNSDPTDVDIGFHYVAVDACNNPLDSDGDDLADYLEDANGNGVYDDVGDWANWSVRECPRPIYERVIDGQIPGQRPSAWFKLNDDNATPDPVSLGDAMGGLPLVNVGGAWDPDAFVTGNSAFSFTSDSARLTTQGDLINGGAGNQQGAISLLFRSLTGLTTLRRYVFWQEDSTHLDDFGVFFEAAGGLKVQIGGETMEILPANAIVFGAWYYLAITWDENIDVATWYLGRVGGTLDTDTINLVPGRVVGNSSTLYLGNRINDDPPPDFENALRGPGTGALDEIAFWTRELTGTEVNAQFNRLNALFQGPSLVFDLDHWEIMLPVDKSNQLEPIALNPLEISTGWLNSGFKYVHPNDCTKKYFYRDCNTMVFEAPYNGAVQGSTGPRSELRGRKADGNEHNWDPGDDGGTHILDATCAVNTVGNGELIIGQIHAKNYSAVPFVVLAYDNRPSPPLLRLTVKHNPKPKQGEENFQEIKDFPIVPLDELINYQLKIVGSDTSAMLEVTVNGELWSRNLMAPPFLGDPANDRPHWTTTTLYFKAGSYYPHSSSGTAKVTFYSLGVSPQP